MSDSVPHAVLGLAIFVNFLSFVAVILGLLLCFMLWRHGEGLSYILLLSVGTTLGAIQGIVVHIDYTLNWKQIQIGRYEQSQKTHYQTAMFGKSDTGWRSVFGWLGIYLYNYDSLLVLSWAITLFIGTWNIRVKPAQKRIMAVVFKTTAVILPAIMVAVCQIRMLSEYPFLFLIVVNIIMTVSMVSGFVLVLAILYKYLMTRSVFKRFFSRSNPLARGSLSLGTVSTVTTGTQSEDGRTTTDKLLIIRFSIIMLVLIIFEVALIVYELVNFQRNRRNQASHTKFTGPDLSVEQARVDLFQYIPGVVPSIVAFCIFGTTATFRREYKEALMACFCCFYPHGSSQSTLWRSAQSQSYGRQRSIDVEASHRNRSVSMDINAGIAVEVKTEISLTPISSVEPAAMRPRRRVSFSGTSVIPDRSSYRSNKFNTHARGLFSPQRRSRPSALGASPQCSGNPSPARTRRSQSQVTQMRQHSVGKALPPLPPQATRPDQGVSLANPNPIKVDFLNTASAQGPSWLSTDSKSSLIEADAERALNH